MHAIKTNLQKQLAVIELHPSTRVKSFNKTHTASTILIKSGDCIEIIQLNKIIRIQAAGSYSYIHIDERRPMLVSASLKQVRSRLPSNTFIKTHQSHIVNIDRIERYSASFIYLSNEEQIPISRRNKKQVELHILKFHQHNIIS